MVSHFSTYIPDLWDEFLPVYPCQSDDQTNKLCSFRDWLSEESMNISKQFSDYMIWTLPSPREDYYKSSDYLQIQRIVTEEANSLVDGLGFYPFQIDMEVLGGMQTYANAILMLGLIFDIIIMLFVILSILLIYSLLMISVESKTFEFGVMRMVGLNHSGIVSMIVIQAFMFVLPSVVMGFLLCFPALSQVYSKLFTDDMGIDAKPVPSPAAVGQALVVGVMIPIISSIVPI